MKRRMKTSLLLVLVLTLSLTLAGCGGSKLAAGFDENTVKQAARSAIDKMNAKEYSKITDEMVRDDLKKALSADVLAGAAAQIIGDSGAFDSYANEVVAGSKSKTTNEDYAVAVMVAKYANKKVTYTISFDTSMKIVGFYMK